MGTKISELAAATTPLASVDTLLVVQGGVTKKVPVSGLPSVAGLTNLTESKSVASPNATIPVVSLTATSAEVNVDLAIIPKGSGALLLQVPNDSASGGAKRGLGAIDLQRNRGGAGQVASGARAVLLGGVNSTASGTESAVISAYFSTASGTNAAIMGGSTNAATANNAVVAGGSSNTANGDASSIVGGSSATTRTISGAEARASGAFGAQGDAQRQRHILRRATSDATASVLTTDGNSSAAATNQVVLPNQGAYHFTGTLVARSSAGDCAAFEFKGAIKRGANAAATSLVSAVTPVVVAADSGASAWALAVSVNTTLGCLSLTVTGAAATTIRWVADIETVEVVG